MLGEKISWKLNTSFSLLNRAGYVLVVLSSLTSGVREVLSSLPAIWASERVSLVFIQASFAVDSPTACHLIRIARYMKADLTHQFVRWCVHKLAVIPASLGSIGKCQFWLV